MPFVFIALLVASLALGFAGCAAALVCAAAIPAWVAFVLVLAPAIRRYRAAIGLAGLRAAEVSGWRALRVHLAGGKVVALGLLTSALPFLGAAAQWLGGQNLNLFFGPQAAGRLGFGLGATVFVLPFATSWLHIGALRDAAECQPQAGPNRIPVASPNPAEG